MNWNLLDHNPNHFITIGKHRFCARCLGTIAAGILSSIFFAAFYFANIRFEFIMIFILSWLLAGICIIDWFSVKLGVRSGSNNIRVITGASLGVAFSMYFWLLPVGWISKIISLIFIHLIFSLFVYYVRCRENNIPLTQPYDLAMKMYGDKMYSCTGCGCCPGCAGCCCESMCGQYWWVIALVGCAGVCCLCSVCGIAICPVCKK